MLTCRRPEGLRRLLYALQRTADTHAVEVFVVDNEPSGGSLEIVKEVRANNGRVPMNYAIETRAGVSFGRNRCIHESINGGFDVLVFIDDDEVPGENWLNELLDGLNKYKADAVAGPVIPRFENPPPEWILRGKFFERKRFRSGTLRRSVGTGNVAIRVQALKESGLKFDERLALSGGEDSLFFREFTSRGYSLVWVDEAPVYEYVTAERMTPRWLVRRAFRVGTVASFVDQTLAKHWSTCVVRFAKGLARVVQGIVLFPVASLFLGMAGMVKCAQLVSYGIGVITGLLGVLHFEYAERHRG